jgi:hypothetical protein
MKIKNIAGTSQATCRCGSWLNHWLKYSGWPSVEGCSVKYCTNKDIVGAHVQEIGGDGTWRILPLCAKCNAADEELETSEFRPLVLAGTVLTCGRRS